MQNIHINNILYIVSWDDKILILPA